MRTTVLALSAVVVLATACTPEWTDQAKQRLPHTQTRTPDQETMTRVQIYTAVIRQLVTKDYTLGRDQSPFGYVYVVNGPLKKANDPLGQDLFGPAPEPFPSEVVEGIKEELQDLPPVQFISDGSRARRGRQGMGGVKKDGVIISLGPSGTKEWTRTGGQWAVVWREVRPVAHLRASPG